VHKVCAARGVVNFIVIHNYYQFFLQIVESEVKSRRFITISVEILVL
jgi:hypothetical protein